ncbi:hypothetical protein ACU4GA_11200 [Methylobacterium oryzae CBMB20]
MARWTCTATSRTVQPWSARKRSALDGGGDVVVDSASKKWLRTTATRSPWIGRSSPAV